MTQFILPLNSIECHERFDALPDFVQGYIEAAFFCGVVFWDDSGDCEELGGVGPDNLDPDAWAGMEAHAARFYIANAADLVEACRGGGYDMQRAGNDLWFSATGHGTGFWDRDLGDLGDRLHHAARRHGEIDLFPVPLDPETGEPLPGYHVDHNAPSDARPDPDNPDSWSVFLCLPVEPLSDAERAALVALAGEPPEPLPHVGGRYGAPMGRPSDVIERGDNLTARRVALDPGGYDSGGAYWGARAPGRALWRVTSELSGATAYVDARTASEAIERVFSGDSR